MYIDPYGLERSVKYRACPVLQPRVDNEAHVLEAAILGRDAKPND